MRLILSGCFVILLQITSVTAHAQSNDPETFADIIAQTEGLERIDRGKAPDHANVGIPPGSLIGMIWE